MSLSWEGEAEESQRTRFDLRTQRITGSLSSPLETLAKCLQELTGVKNGDESH